MRPPCLFSMLVRACLPVHRVALSSALALALTAGASESGIESFPLAESSRSGDDQGTLFRRLSPEETGIDFAVPIDLNHPLKRAYHSSSACGGVAIGDINLDGRPDIFVGSGPGDNALYLQRDGLTFENIAGAVGVTGDGRWAVGVTLVDIDNDGDLDIYVCNYDAPNQLFINLLIDGDKRRNEVVFEERAADFGLDIVDGSVIAAFADYDRDGDLDMYLLTHQIYRDGGRPDEPIRIYEENGKYFVEERLRRWYHVEQNKRGDHGEFLYTESGRRDYLFRNDGEAGFVDVTEEVGISMERHWGNSATWWDYNNDGWPDLYVGNDFKSPDFLYRNNGDGTFTEVSQQHLRHTTWFSMGAVQSDFNNNGLFDFVIADMMPRTHYMQKASMASMASRSKELENVDGVNQLMRNSFYINTGTDQFMEGAWMANLAHTEWTWAIRSGDFDNDGLNDLFFCNGVPRQFNHSDLPPINHQTLVGRTSWDHYENAFGGKTRREQNMAFQNRGDFQFEDVSKDWGLDHIGMSYGASLCDLDGDGRLDLLVTNLEDPLSLYLNVGDSGNRIVLELRGTQSNRYGIGALAVAATSDGEVRSRQLFPYGGFLDSDEPLIHFGLGDADKVVSLRIEWPSGQVQEFRNLDVNRRYRITEPAEPAEKSEPVERREPSDPWFEPTQFPAGFRHVEQDFDDFDRQPLMTLQLSRLGPGQAWGDVNGSGKPDLYFGGAAGQPGQLFINRTEPGSDGIQLVPSPMPAFSLDAAMEDMGAVFFDADGDGDLDLYVASGSIECEPGDEVLLDRLYLNNGRGEFTRAPEGSLPDLRLSSSVVAPADFDRDGDIDLFIGTRSVPGDYPSPPRSVLLQNDGGRFTVVEEAIAPGLSNCGMVSGAIWTDVDNDGWLDLLVTTDWGPVRLFRNRGGTLEEATEEAGLAGDGLECLGWWTGIDARDINNNGHIDFVVANLGRNTRYQASLDSPELLFYNDFDNTSKRHIVEARFLVENNRKICYPWAGFLEAGEAMPHILDEMQTFHNYASRSLPEIYNIKKLESSLQYRANQMDSSVFLNDGEGRFERVSLPVLSQISPAYGIVLRDVNLDGRVDCYLVQNLYSVTDEVGEMASGLSLLLEGTGDPAEPFRPVWPRESGLIVPGDAKSLAAVDLNGNGREDFVIGINDADPRVFLNVTDRHHDTRSISLRLAGSPGNPQAIGARITARAGELPPQTAEISGGGSYLAQSDSTLVFAVPSGPDAGEVALEIRWPDGSTETRTVDATSPFVTLKQP